MNPRRPKTAAEILANATYAPDPVQTVPSQLLNVFSVNPLIQDLPFENLPVIASEVTRQPGEESPGTSGSKFKRPVTPNFFGAKDRSGMEAGRARRSSDAVDSILYSEDLPEFDLRSASPTESVSAPSMTLHDTCISDVLELLRNRRISPFDFILEVLDGNQPRYHSYQTEFYKEASPKLYAMLDLISQNQNGQKKIRTWIKRSCLETVCEIETAPIPEE
ncbi:hypothetical protein HYPSUDRAFT_543237 [Hypholoma sublateritium FD-334 SS-4]|uniref:Uncharacterized protein n=1 Tax=Hypholoma sublateritium (strain FD-334 SS-4) TaxID=945553 RepID=A0A0D2N2V5_HYPSF|nr:hypothetical protein HYPSUDRAFT_543237 [Hypholoma sublateritium FD-334 SS-4]